MPLSKLRSGILPTSSSKKSQADKATSSQLTLTSTGSSGKQTPSPSSSPLSSLRRPYTRTSSNQSSTAASLARRISLPESDGNSHPSSMADAPPLHTMDPTQKARKASTRSPGLRKAQSAHSLLAQYQQQSSDHRDVSPRTKIPLSSKAQTRYDFTASASAMPRRLVDEFDPLTSSIACHRSFDGALPARNKALDAAASPPSLPRSPGSTDLRSKRRGLIQPPLPATLSSSSSSPQQATNSKPLVLVTAGEETVPSATERVPLQVDTLGGRSHSTDAPRPVEPSRNRSSSTSSNSDKEYHQHVVLTARVERLGVSCPKTMVLSKMTSQSNFSVFKTAANASRDQPSHSSYPPSDGSDLANASGSVSTPNPKTPSTAQPLTRTALARQLVAERARLRESMQKVPLEVLRDRVLSMDRVGPPARQETSSTDVSYDSSIPAHAVDALDIDGYEVTQSAPGSPDSLLSTFSGALARTSRYSRPSARLPREVATSDCSTASSTMSHLRLPAGATLAPSFGDNAGHRALRASASSDALNPRTSAAVKQSIHSRLRLLHPSDSSPALPMGSLAEAHNEELLFDVHSDYSPLRTPMTATAYTADQLVQTPSRAMFPSAYKDKRPPSDEPFSSLLQQDEAHSSSHDGHCMSHSTTSSASIGPQPVDNADHQLAAPSRSLSIPELSCVDTRPSISASKDEAQQGYLSRLLTRSTNLKTVDNDTSQPPTRKAAPRSRSRPASKQSLLTTLGSKTFGQASRRQGVAISEPRLTSHTSLPPAVPPSLGAEAPSFDPSHSHSCPSLATQSMAQSDSTSSLQSSGLVPSRTTTVPSLPDTSVDSGYQLSSPNSSMRSTRNRWWNKMARRSSIARADPPPSLNLNLGNSTRLSREVSAELQYTDWSPSSPSPQTFAQRITKATLPGASQESRQVSHHHSKSTPEVDVKMTKRTRNPTGGARLE